MQNGAIFAVCDMKKHTTTWAGAKLHIDWGVLSTPQNMEKQCSCSNFHHICTTHDPILCTHLQFALASQLNTRHMATNDGRCFCCVPRRTLGNQTVCRVPQVKHTIKFLKKNWFCPSTFFFYQHTARGTPYLILVFSWYFCYIPSFYLIEWISWG